ncbi:MAG: sodium:calcium antiporter [Candidatus Pacearchaeota archaeon]
MLLINLLLFFIAGFVLVFSGRWIVKALVKIAQFLEITEFAVGFIIMAMATSLPEFSVAISSGLAKNTALSFGNVIGANILDITLIVGILTLLGNGIKIEQKHIKKDSLYMVGIAILPLILFCINKSLSRIDGIILLSVFGLYIFRLFKKSPRFEKKFKQANKIKKFEIVANIALLIFSIALLFTSAKFLIKYAMALSTDLNLPSIMIGLFLISFGTTLPELTFGIRAVLAAHSNLSIGNLMGAIVVNSTLVIGTAALLSPITAVFELFAISAVFLALVCFLFATFISSGRRLDTREGIALVLLYVFFVILEFYIQGTLG